MGKWIEIVARSLRALHLDSIRKQILVLAAAATLVPALVLIVMLSRRNQGSSGGPITPELRGVSAEAAWLINQWLDERLYDLRVAATSYAVSDNLVRVQGGGGSQALARLRDYVNSVRERSADCEALVLLDARGHVVTGSGGRMSSGSCLGMAISPRRESISGASNPVKETSNCSIVRSSTSSPSWV